MHTSARAFASRQRTAAHSRLSALVATSYPESMRAFGALVESEAGAEADAGVELGAGAAVADVCG